METKVIDIRPRDELTYYPFTDTMWNSTRGKIAAIKVWREFHKLAPLAWDKHGAPVVPSLRSAKTVVEEAARSLRDRRQDPNDYSTVSVTCRVSEDYNIFSVLDGDGVRGYDTLTRKQRG